MPSFATAVHRKSSLKSVYTRHRAPERLLGRFLHETTRLPGRDDAKLARLLRSWADPRAALDTNGFDQYGCTALPSPGVLELGSCTASTVSPAGWAAAQRVGPFHPG